MASPAKSTAYGLTVAFATSTALNSLKLRDVRWAPGGRDMIDVTDYGSGAVAAGEIGNAEFLGSDVFDAGAFEFEFFLNPDVVIPSDAAEEAVTITWPDGATWIFQGIIEGPTDAAMPQRDAATMGVRVKVTGGIDITAAA